MVAIIAVLLSITAFVLSIWTLHDFIYTQLPTKQNKQGLPCLTFEQFLSFYSISPDKFYLQDDHVSVYFDDKNGIWLLNRKDFYFKTNKDLKQYQKYHQNDIKQKEKQAIEKQATEATEKLIELMKSEIAKKSKEADSQIVLALCEQYKILQRMKKED